MSVDDPFEDDRWLTERAEGEAEVLTISLHAWEGPLDLLLVLARRQKVDLREISILELVDQYLVFINQSKQLQLEAAADYLVMAAWLAYLKSLLLLPSDPEIEPSPEELALRLQLRLQRLNAMREAGARLMARDRIGRDVFLRTVPEGLKIERRAKWQANIFDLIQAYGQINARSAPVLHHVAERPVITLDMALQRLETMLAQKLDWTRLEMFLPDNLEPTLGKSALASHFVAALELARMGKAELQQDGAFTPLYIRTS